MRLKQLCTAAGVIGSIVTHSFGGWDKMIEALMVFMIIDYISGIAVAGIFKKSEKTEDGKLSSKVGFKGLCRKCMILLCVIVGYWVDVLLGTDIVRNAVIIGFATNELISIVENLGAMELAVPKALLDAIKLLKNKSEGEENDGN